MPIFIPNQTLFGSNVGNVGLVSTSGLTPAVVILGADRGRGEVALSARTHLTAITAFAHSGSSGLSVGNTTADTIRAYVFAEKPGQFQVSGVIFAKRCITFSSGFDNLDRAGGVDLAVLYYEAFRVSSLRAPITIYLGPFTAFRVMLISCTVQNSDPDTYLGQFQMTGVAFPRVKPRRFFPGQSITGAATPTGGNTTTTDTTSLTPPIETSAQRRGAYAAAHAADTASPLETFPVP